MVATILWPSIVAAILPMSLQEIIQRLPEIAVRLAKMTGRQQRQVNSYRACHSNPTVSLMLDSC